MTSRQIEECFDIEMIEEKEYNDYISFLLNTKCILLVDPYAINIEDLVDAKPGKVIIVRVRRPFWGRGDLHKYIHKVEI